MTTYRQLVYMTLDELKLLSDDATYTEDHVMFLLNKYRAFVFKKAYENSDMDSIPDTYKQTLCVELEEATAFDGSPCTGSNYLRSKGRIPDPLTDECELIISPEDFFQGAYMAYVPRNRFRFVGHNRFIQNIIYVAMSPDNHLYLKSRNPQFSYLEKIRVTGVFEDADAAAEYSCDDGEDDGTGSCDPMDQAFPMEEALVPEVTELVLKELLGAAYRPRDDRNDARDNLADIAAQAAQQQQQ